MQRGSTYEIHNKTMNSFAELFNGCPECSNLEFRPNPEETFGNDGYIIDHDTGIEIGYDWERRDDHFKNGVLRFETLGQLERKLVKDNIQISLQCDETETAVAVGWHKDWLEEVKVVKSLKTDTDKRQITEMRTTSKYKIFMYTEISELKKHINEYIKTGAYRFDPDEMRRSIVRTINRDGYDLDEQQINAVLCDKKYEQVVAGAGAGKTMTVTAKVRYLTDCLDVDPKDILVLSLSRATVAELKEKIKPKCRISTFHALGYTILGHEGDVGGIRLKSFLSEAIRERISAEGYDEDFADSLTQYFEAEDPVAVSDGEEDNEEDTKAALSEIFSADGIKAEGERLIDLLRVFIEQMKINGSDEEAFAAWKDEAEDARTVLFLEICKPLFIAYREYLAKNDMLDFSDMINNAENCLYRMAEDPERAKNVRKYKYIIVDEYQDISLQRFKLIKALIAYSGDEFKQLMVVGDDWQAIYAFSGSRVDLFTGFKELAEAGDDHECIKLVNTYRNPQALIDIAGDFVSKNPKQIRKELRSQKQYKDKELVNPVSLISYEKGAEVWACREALRRLKSDREKDGRDINGSVLILGRFGFNGRNLKGRFPFFGDDPDDVEMKPIFTADPDGVHLHPEAEDLKDMTDIRYMTVHRSKGLEAEDVIVLGMDEDKRGYGFPCTKEDDEILNLVNKKETMEINVSTGNKLWLTDTKLKDYPEERRLFYVALTRTKNRVYLLGRKDSLSRYAANELLPDNAGKEKRKVTEIKYVCEELEKYSRAEDARKEYLKSAYVIDDKGKPADPLYKIFGSIREIYAKTKYVSVKERTLTAFLYGSEDESISRKRNWGRLNELSHFACLKDLGAAETEVLLNKMISAGLLYRGWFDKPTGSRDFIRYNRKQVDKWNSMSDEDIDDFKTALKTNVADLINNSSKPEKMTL